MQWLTTIDHVLKFITASLTSLLMIWQIRSKITKSFRLRRRRRRIAAAKKNANASQSATSETMPRRSSFDALSFFSMLVIFIASILTLILFQFLPASHPLTRGDTAMIGLNVVTAIVSYHAMNRLA